MTLGSFGSFGSTFNAPNYGVLSFQRKERPCMRSSFLDVSSPGYKVKAELHNTLSGSSLAYGRIKPDCELHKRPPRPPPKSAISAPRAVAEQVVHMSDSSNRFPFHNRSGRMTDRGNPSDVVMRGSNDYIRATTSGGSLSATLVFPRSFKRGTTTGLMESPRFIPVRKPYTPRRNDVDPYGTRDNNLWVKRATPGTPNVAFGPSKLQRSPRSLRECMGQAGRMETGSYQLHSGRMRPLYHDPTSS